MAPQRTLTSAQAQATLAANNYDINSIMAGWVDRGSWVYHDTMTVAAGVAVPQMYTFFQVPIGQNDSLTNVPKTKLQTNMLNNGQFSPPRCLILNQLGFYFCGPYSTSTKNYTNMALADIEMICNSCYFEFTIDQKIFFEGRLEWHPPGVGIYGASTANNDFAWGLGFPSPHATYVFGNYAKYIAPLQNFGLKITFPMGTLPLASSSGVGINLVAIMKGLTDRSVQ
jgi:hypothetical protein